MAYSPTELLTVFLDAQNQRRKVGRLAFKDRRVLFEYDASFIASGIEISPIKLPLRPGVFTADTTIFDGLFGVFNDSLPDRWGRLKLDRTVEKHGIHRGQLNPLDRLAYVGRHGMGTLSYEPELGFEDTDDAPLALDKIAEETAAVLEGEDEAVLEELLRLNGSSSGARPKIVAQVSADKKRIIHGRQELQPSVAHWMIKFSFFQGARDAGAIEYAYSLMAKDAGVEMPESHLFRTKQNKYFGTKRFDREREARIPMHSLGGLIHADHRSPSLDYDMVLREKSFVEELLIACSTSAVDPDQIILELTETAAMENPAESLAMLTRLRVKGFHLSLDDFGIGYSSMLQLVKLPFSEIKIDKSFVMTSRSSEESRTVIESIVHLGRSLHLKSFAEGVEDMETLEYLRSLKCDVAQGYFISRPVSEQNLMVWIQTKCVDGCWLPLSHGAEPSS